MTSNIIGCCCAVSASPCLRPRILGWRNQRMVDLMRSQVCRQRKKKKRKKTGSVKNLAGPSSISSHLSSLFFFFFVFFVFFSFALLLPCARRRASVALATRCSCCRMRSRMVEGESRGGRTSGARGWVPADLAALAESVLLDLASAAEVRDRRPLALRLSRT